MSDSVRPHKWQPIRLPRPWDSPGKNTGVGFHFLLECMKVKSEREVAQSCPTPSDPMDCSLPGSSAHGIFQARVLESGAIAFSVSKSMHMLNIKVNIWELWGFHVIVYLLSHVWLFCDPLDCSPLGFSVPEISQARLLEWVAISFSTCPSGYVQIPGSAYLHASSEDQHYQVIRDFCWLSLIIWALRWFS